MILLAAALLLDGTIADLLRALREEDVDRRQAAVEALCDLGEAALENVRAARAEADDAEARARLAEIEARIEAERRRRTFPGGPEVLGLRAALTARWDPDRDQAVFTLEIMNVDARERACVEPQGWDVRLPRWSLGSNRNRLRLEIRAIRVDDPGTAGGGRRISVGGCGGFSPPPLVRLQPGETRSAELRLGRGTDARSLQLRPGVYEARAVFFAKKLLPGAAADLETDWVRFTVP